MKVVPNMQDGTTVRNMTTSVNTVSVWMQVPKYSEPVVGHLRGDGELWHRGSGLEERHRVSHDVE